MNAKHFETLANEAAAAKDYRKAAALYAVAADMRNEPAGKDRKASKTWRKAYAANARSL